MISFIDGTQNILVQKNNTIQVLFPKYYNSIVGINGVCDNLFTGYDSQSFTSKKLEKMYFFVQEKNSKFYVDIDGVEYKLKVGFK